MTNDKNTRKGKETKEKKTEISSFPVVSVKKRSQDNKSKARTTKFGFVRAKKNLVLPHAQSSCCQATLREIRKRAGIKNSR